MSPEEVKEAIAKLKAERGDWESKEVTTPGKGHWLWGIWQAKYCGKHVP